MRSGMLFHTLLIRQPALRKLRLSATRRFRRKLDSRFATCSLTREGFIERVIVLQPQTAAYLYVCRDRASLQQVADGPMSHRSQIAYLSIAKIKIIYGNNIFTFCLRTAEDVGPYKFWHMPFVSSMDGCAAITDIFGMGNPSPTAFSYFSIVGEAFRLPFFDLHHCSVSDFIRTHISKLPKGILLRVISNPTPTPI